MTLRGVQKNWNKLAETDPFRAILDGAGCTDPESFFATGKIEIGEVIEYAATLNFPKSRKKALDFGCGAGRLTQALAEHFDEVRGVDISPVMIQLAEKHNQHPERCRYVLNEEGHLRQFEDRQFDLIYSNITLQHMRPRWSKAYIQDFVRLLAPGGLLIFLVPDRRIAPLRARLLPGNAYQYLVHFSWPLMHPGQSLVEMFGVRQKTVLRLIDQHGGKTLDVHPMESAGEDWETYRYAVTVET